jgi:hypothetical protein
MNMNTSEEAPTIHGDKQYELKKSLLKKKNGLYGWTVRQTKIILKSASISNPTVNRPKQENNLNNIQTTFTQNGRAGKQKVINILDLSTSLVLEIVVGPWGVKVV